MHTYLGGCPGCCLVPRNQTWQEVYRLRPPAPHHIVFLSQFNNSTENDLQWRTILETRKLTICCRGSSLVWSRSARKLCWSLMLPILLNVHGRCVCVGDHLCYEGVVGQLRAGPGNAYFGRSVEMKMSVSGNNGRATRKQQVKEASKSLRV